MMFQKLPMFDDKSFKKDKTIYYSAIAVTFFVIITSSYLLYRNLFLENKPSIIDNNINVNNEVEKNTKDEIDNKKTTEYYSSEIKILNATNKKGLAQDLLSKLKDKKYKNLSTGNTSEEYEENVVMVPNKDMGSLEKDLKDVGFSTYTIKNSDEIKIIIAK